MLNSFNFAIEHGVFHRDQKTSLISLLLKKGKDPLDQWSQTQFLEGHSSAQFSSNQL